MSAGGAAGAAVGDDLRLRRGVDELLRRLRRLWWLLWRRLVGHGVGDLSCARRRG